MPLVSVIVPVFRAEKFLRKCIESIISQTCQDFELILVEDGSPDNSAIICDDYASRFTNIHVIHKKNGGPSDSRNVGLDNAQGQWIVFVDADDKISDTYLSHLLECNPERDKMLLSMQDNYNVDMYGCIVPTHRLDFKDEQIIVGKNQDIIEKYRLLHHYGIYAKLFSREIIEKNHIRFNTQIDVCEDGLFINQYETYINKIFLSSYKDYYYVMPSPSKFSLCSNVKLSDNGYYELAKEYSILSLKLIERYKLQDCLYANDLMNVFVNRYDYCIEHNNYKGIYCPDLKYYKPQSKKQKLFKFMVSYTNIYLYIFITKIVALYDAFRKQ